MPLPDDDKFHSIEEAMAAIQDAFPDAVVKVVRVGEKAQPLTGIELWRRCWEREDREREEGEQDHRSGQHPFDKELDEVREIGQQISVYCQLRYICIEEDRKPGWAAHFYKALYGTWPDREWEKVPPMRPTGMLYQLVERRQRSFRQSMREYHHEKGADAEREVDARREGDGPEG